jgi:hypothetical protein
MENRRWVTSGVLVEEVLVAMSNLSVSSWDARLSDKFFHLPARVAPPALITTKGHSLSGPKLLKGLVEPRGIEPLTS